jgi:hypothetical protein
MSLEKNFGTVQDSGVLAMIIALVVITFACDYAMSLNIDEQLGLQGNRNGEMSRRAEMSRPA